MMNIISGDAAGIMAFIPPPPEESFANFHNPESHLDYAGVISSHFRRSMSSSMAGMPWEMREEDDMSDDGGSLQVRERKRRLSLEQVKALEKSFEVGSKLEPERKMQLARILGLQPRQIAVWFQNRRARSKTKQLEKDYDLLKRRLEAISAHNDALKSQNENLRSQLLALRNRESNGVVPTTFPRINLNQETQGSSWNATTTNKPSENNIAMIDASTRPSNQPVFPPPQHLHLSSISHPPHQEVDRTIRDDAFCHVFAAARPEHAEFLAMAAATTAFPSSFSFS